MPWVSAIALDNAAGDDHDPADRRLVGLLDALELPDWQRDALCREYPAEMWFPARGDVATANRARLICSACAVIDECAAFAATLPSTSTVGIWAGTAGRERRAARRTAA